MICNELDVENAEQIEGNLDDVFLNEETNMHETNAKTQKRTRELHLEMVGDKVTYVRVY